MTTNSAATAPPILSKRAIAVGRTLAVLDGVSLYKAVAEAKQGGRSDLEEATARACYAFRPPQEHREVIERVDKVEVCVCDAESESGERWKRCRRG